MLKNYKANVKWYVRNTYHCKEIDMELENSKLITTEDQTSLNKTSNRQIDFFVTTNLATYTSPFL